MKFDDKNSSTVVSTKCFNFEIHQNFCLQFFMIKETQNVSWLLCRLG